MTQVDPRRLIPRTDQLLALPPVQEAQVRLGEHAVRAVVRDIQDRARRGDLAPDQVQDAVLASLVTHRNTRLRPVLNATGVVVHTNLGRAPLAAAQSTHWCPRAVTSTSNSTSTPAPVPSARSLFARP